MKKKLLTVVLSATMVIGSVFSAFAAETQKEDKVLYSTSEAYTLDGDAATSKSVDNPLKGLETDKIVIEYNLTSSQKLAAWEGLAQFYNVEKNAGLAHLSFWPQICLNNFEADGKWGEFGTGADIILADTLCDGQPHTYKYVITPETMEIYVDGKAYTYSALKGNSANITTIKESCKALFDFLTSAEKFSLGCGSVTTWWAELDSTSIVNSLTITASVKKEVETDTTKNESPSGEPETDETTTKDESPSGQPETDDTTTEKPSTDETTDDTTTAADETTDAGVVTEEELSAVAESAKVEGENVPEDSKLVFDVIDKKDTAFVAADAFVTKNFADSAKLGKYAFLEIDLVNAEGTKVQPLNNGKVKVTLNVKAFDAFKAAKENDEISVYRVSDDGKDIVFVGTSKVAADGTLSFDTDHFSKYLFVAGAQAADSGDDIKDNAKTGDTAPIMLLAMAALAACGTVAYTYVNKKRVK